MWDLYSQQPILLDHPADLQVAVAAVSRARKGVVWWNANYLIDIATTHMPGSGFAYYKIEGKPEWVEDKNCWRVASSPDRVYLFRLPTEEMLRQWEEFKQYIPSLEQLHRQASKY